MALGGIESAVGGGAQWIALEVIGGGGRSFRVWSLVAVYPPETRLAAGKAVHRYLVQAGDAEAVEYYDPIGRRAVLPSLGPWNDLFPRATVPVDVAEENGPFPEHAKLLGHTFRRVDTSFDSKLAEPPQARLVRLRSDLLLGLPSNTRQKDERRRYDGTDYELIRLTQDDYRQMVSAGFNCVRVDADQLRRVQDLETYYWGVGPDVMPFPECLYRSPYLGPALFLDEPAVVTRDHLIRPRLAAEPDFRKAITPAVAMAAFRGHFEQVLRSGAPWQFLNGLRTGM